MLHFHAISRRHNGPEDAPAELRNERDSERLAACASLIEHALDDLIPYLGPLENPASQWRPDNLSLALEQQLHSIRIERNRLGQ
jgi:hypothetical protein